MAIDLSAVHQQAPDGGGDGHREEALRWVLEHTNGREVVVPTLQQNGLLVMKVFIANNRFSSLIYMGDVIFIANISSLIIASLIILYDEKKIYC